jgi:hypothetical protein
MKLLHLVGFITKKSVQEHLERTGNLYAINMYPTEQNFKSSSVSGCLCHIRSAILFFTVDCNKDSYIIYLLYSEESTEIDVCA